MAERSNAAVLKTVGLARVPWVRIPPLPPALPFRSALSTGAFRGDLGRSGRRPRPRTDGDGVAEAGRCRAPGASGRGDLRRFQSLARNVVAVCEPAPRRAGPEGSAASAPATRAVTASGISPPRFPATGWPDRSRWRRTAGSWRGGHRAARTGGACFRSARRRIAARPQPLRAVTASCRRNATARRRRPSRRSQDRVRSRAPMAAISGQGIRQGRGRSASARLPRRGRPRSGGPGRAAQGRERPCGPPARDAPGRERRPGERHAAPLASSAPTRPVGPVAPVPGHRRPCA